MAGSRAGAWSSGLTAFRAVEDDPNGEIVGEVFEAVLGPSRHEQHVARTEGMALRPVDERAASTDDHVQLVAGMRRLRVGAAGSVDLDLHATVPQHLREPLSFGSRQPLYRLSYRRPASPGLGATVAHGASCFRIASIRRPRLSLTSGHSSSMML